MNEKAKGLFHALVNIVGNILVLGIVPTEYKIYVLLAFNLIQVVLAYLDPTYALVAIGRKLGRTFTKEDLK